MKWGVEVLRSVQCVQCGAEESRKVSFEMGVGSGFVMYSVGG